MHTTTDPVLPRYDLGAIETARAKIVDDVSFTFDEVPLIGGNFTEFRRRMKAAFPGIPAAAMDDTLATVRGTTWTPETRDEFAWRFAGNLPSLRRGRAALPWDVQRQNEWAPLEILSVRPGKTDRGEPGAYITCIVHAGTPCPALIVKFWERKLLRFVARELGFPRARPNVRGSEVYCHPSQLVGTHFYGLFESDLFAARRDKPMFSRVRASSSQVERNRDLIRARASKPCSLGFSVPCHECGIGRDRCPLATHARTYVHGMCPSCGDERAVIDPGKPARCIRCSSG